MIGAGNKNNPLSGNTRASIMLVVCLAITFFLYFAGLEGEYYFDDAHVLQHNPFIKIDKLDFSSLDQAAHSFAAGGRELSMLSFALNYYLFGNSTWWFKFFNLILHCLNGVGLFILTTQLSSRLHYPNRAQFTDTVTLYFPIVVSALWLVHPINLIPVLYISQRMALMSSFFVIFGLIFYVWARSTLTSLIRKIIYLPLGIAGFMIIGYKCKENAVLLPVYILILEITILKFRTDKQWDRVVIGMFGLGLMTGLLLLVYQFWQHPDWITGGYRGRYFTLEERVLTEFRALVFYISQILVPSNRYLSLWHDDFGLSTGLFSPKTTFFSLITLLGIFSCAIISLKKLPFLSLGILWFFVSHSLESTIFAVELVHEHRNYLASFGIIAGVVAIVLHLLGNRKTIYFSVVIGVFIAFSIVLFQRSNIWSNGFVHATYEARNRPNSAIASYQLGQRYYDAAMQGRQGAEALALPLLLRAASNDRYTVAPELLLVVFSEHENIEYRQEWLQTASEKILKYPYMYPSKSALQAYLRCLKQKTCAPHGTEVEDFFDTVLKTDDDNMLTTAAFYFTEVNIDYERAELGFKKALRNKAANWVNYLSFLIYLNKFDEACNVYEEFNEKLRKYQLKKIMLHINRLNFFDQELKNC